MNAEQASKRLTQEPTRRVIGMAAADGTVRANEVHQTCRGNGDGKQAKLTSSNTGSPSGDAQTRSTGNSRETGWAVWGGGEVRSTEEAG